MMAYLDNLRFGLRYSKSLERQRPPRPGRSEPDPDGRIPRKPSCSGETPRDFDNRLWGLEEHLMGERLEDGKIYVRRRAERP
ncbi:MAG: hypothetical protein Q9217_001346 [Psora testacea]